MDALEPIRKPTLYPLSYEGVTSGGWQRPTHGTAIRPPYPFRSSCGKIRRAVDGFA